MALRRVPLQRGDKPLTRRTPLAPGLPLQRRSETPRTAPSLPRQGALGSSRESTLARKQLKAIPRPVRPEERRTRKVVRARSGDLCERCGAPGTNMSHRKPVSQGGLWEPANLIHLCGMGNASGCHGWVHADPDGIASATGWSLKSWQDPAVESVLYPDGTRWLLRDDGGRDRVPRSADDD